MYISIDELKRHAPKTVSMQEYAESLVENEPTIVLRNYNEPTSAPCFEEGVELLDLSQQQPSPGDVANPYGTRPNVPAINVVNAIKAAIGPGGYCLHMSDASYTGYTINELAEYMRNFDSTNLRVWIAETFDCDDFAQVLQGNVNAMFPGIAFGTIWYGAKNGAWGHAVNIFYDYKGNRVWLIEPQNDSFYAFNKTAWKPWVVMI